MQVSCNATHVKIWNPFFFSKNFVAKYLTLKNSLKYDPGLIVKIIIISLSECTVHSCHVHVMLYSLSGGSLEPAVTSLETLQACCNFLWNNSGMSIICYFFFSFYWYCACICSRAMMYVAFSYKSNDLLNWQFEREVDKLINFNYNELHCSVFIICVPYAEGFCLCLLLGSKNTQKQHIDDILVLFNSSYEQLEGESLRHLMVSTFPWMWI